MLATARPEPIRISLAGIEAAAASWLHDAPGALMEYIAAWDEEHAGPRQLYPEPPAWHALGLCEPEDDADFFGVDDMETPALSPTAMRRAREKCTACPIARPCLTAALVNEERFGMWGGTSGRDRAKMRTKLREGATVAELVDAWLSPK